MIRLERREGGPEDSWIHFWVPKFIWGVRARGPKLPFLNFRVPNLGSTWAPKQKHQVKLSLFSNLHHSLILHYFIIHLIII